MAFPLLRLLDWDDRLIGTTDLPDARRFGHIPVVATDLGFAWP
jgi:hypothetical protein